MSCCVRRLLNALVTRERPQSSRDAERAQIVGVSTPGDINPNPVMFNLLSKCTYAGKCSILTNSGLKSGLNPDILRANDGGQLNKGTVLQDARPLMSLK